MHRLTLALAALAAAVAAGVLALPAVADERSCRGTLGKVTVDNLRVPQGATCTLQGTRVKGTITVGRRAALRATAISVVGNVQAENHRHVRIAGGSRIGGSLQVKQGGSATVSRSVFGSDVQFFENSGAIRVSGNRIDGNLQCKENRVRPTGGANVVEGNKEDQCARL